MKHTKTLKKIISASLEKGAEIIQIVLRQKTKISISETERVIEIDEDSRYDFLKDEIVSEILMNFNGDLNGSVCILFSSSSSDRLIKMLLKGMMIDTDDSVDIESIKSGTMIEFGNIVVNSIAGTISNTLKINFDYSIPTYNEIDFNVITDEINRQKIIDGVLISRAYISTTGSNMKTSFLVILKVDNYAKIVTLLEKNNLEIKCNER